MKITVVAAFLFCAVAADCYAVWPFDRLPFSRKPTPAPQQVGPPRFAWETDTLTVKASGTSGAQETPQKTQEAARRAAFTECMDKMIKRVETLKVAGDMKLGQLMRENLVVRHGVELWIQKNIKVVYTDRLSGFDSTGIATTTEGELPLEPFVKELRKLGITPESLPPAQALPGIDASV